MELNTIKKMERYARHDSTIISLGQGIPAWQSDERIRSAAIDAITSGCADHYSDPQGIPQLRQAISEQLIHQDMEYEADEIIVTAGAIEALGVAVRSVITTVRNEIVVVVPVYSAYFKLIEAAGGKVVEVALDEDRGWSLDTKALVAAITENTAAILLCNPNNPTGTIYTRQDLEPVMIAAKAKGVTVIIDEVYRNMTFGQDDFYSPASDSRFHDVVIRVMSFSKDFSLTGWRVGYMQASHRRIPRLLGIHDTLINCTPVVSQYAALAALSVHDQIIRKNKIIYASHRQLMATKLDELSDHLSYVMPQGTYFFFPKIHGAETSDDLCMSLVLNGLATVPGGAFGTSGERHLRLCFGRDEESVVQGMDRLVRYFRSKVVK